jgi:phosphonatase-like hydrolase
MKPIKLVVLDMAGTTVADEGNVAQSFQNAFNRFSLRPDTAVFNRVMGYRKKEAIRIVLAEMAGGGAGDGHELTEKIHDAFIQDMIAHYETSPALRPLPGAVELFAHLQQQGIKVALNTGFVKAITGVILNRLGWADHPHINMVISSDEVPNARPYSDMIDTIRTRLKISSGDAVVKVGDTEVDVQEGRNAGCALVIGVTTGASTYAQMQQYGADYIVNSLTGLPALLNQLQLLV